MTHHLHLDTVIIYTDRFRESLAFYRDRLGLAPKYEDEDYASFETGGSKIALHSSKEVPKSSRHMSFSFNVEDVNGTYKELSGKGVKFAKPPEVTSFDKNYMWIQCEDPNGVTIHFIGPLKK